MAQIMDELGITFLVQMGMSKAIVIHYSMWMAMEIAAIVLRQYAIIQKIMQCYILDIHR
jgi:hypothetical protein